MEATRVAHPTVPDVWLSHFVDACLAAVLVLAPLLMGGRGPIGQLVFVLLPCLAAVVWTMRKALLGTTKWRWSGAEWLLLGGAIVVAIQITPLPQSLLFKLSLGIKQLLPLWIAGGSGGVHLGEWSTLSMTPEFTRGGLVIFLSYALFFLVLVQRIETVEDVGLLLRVVGSAAAIMAVVGLVQFFAGSTNFLGIYAHPSRSPSEVVRGAFQNENHFAHFLSLGLGPLIWWLAHSRQHEKARGSVRQRDPQWRRTPVSQTITAILQPLLLVSIGLVALAGLLTFSRGGVLTMAIAFIACVAIMRWKSLINRRTTLALSAAAIVNLAAMLIFGYDSLALQLGTVFQSRSLTELFAGRTELWNAIGEGISHFYYTGTGVGSHREVYPIFMEEQYDVEYTHGESGYFPLLLETGVCGLALMVVGIATSFFWSLRTLLLPLPANELSSSSKTSTMPLVRCACAIVPGLVASIVHSIADFVWYIPACMVMTIAQVACACRLYQLSRGTANPSAARTSRPSADGAWCQPLHRTAWLALTAVLVLAAWAMLQNRLGPAMAALDWDAYLKHSTVRRGASPITPTQERDRLTAMEGHLINVLQYEPRNARAHLRLAAVYLKQFEMTQRSADNSMDLSQIRDAALASKFATKEAQDAWLSVALGDSRQLLDRALTHSHRAVALSPLQGLGYVQLAELSFLDSPRQDLKQAYIDQAIRVRPHDGQVLFIRGKEAALAGDLNEAFKSWKIAFRQDPEIRQAIIESVADQIPAELFVVSFEPDTKALGQLLQRYQSQGRLEEAKWVGPRFAAALESDAPAKSASEAAGCWHQAQATYSWLGDDEQALRCQQRAVELTPLDFYHRRTLARLLTLQHRHAEAIKHLEWCLRRQPDNEDLRNELVDAKIQGLQDPRPLPVAAKSVGQRRS